MEKTDNEKVTSKRQSMMERLQGLYPDKDFSDDEVLFAQISDDYDGYDKDISKYKEREKALSDLFTSDPRSASFLMNWRSGGDPVVELVRMFGTDIKEALDDPQRIEALAEANKEFVLRVSKEKELEEAYQKNLQESLANIDELQAQEGLTDDQVDAAMALLVNIIKDGIVGIFSRDSIIMAMKAVNHDSDVESAKYEGVVQGKNTRAEEKLRKPAKGDGTPALGGSNGSVPTRQRPSLGALDNFGSGNQTIWERGGEKRTRQ